MAAFSIAPVTQISVAPDETDGVGLWEGGRRGRGHMNGAVPGSSHPHIIVLRAEPCAKDHKRDVAFGYSSDKLIPDPCTGLVARQLCLMS